MSRDTTNSSRVITDSWLPTDLAGNPLHDPLGHYRISDQDISGDPLYYGNVAPDGSWYILCQSVMNNTFRYAAGSAGYRAAWILRASIGYSYFDQTF